MDHTLLGIAGGRYKAETEYGKLPFDLFLLEWWDYTYISQHVFHPLEQLPAEIQRTIQELNHHNQLMKLTRLYIEGGLAIRKKYVDISKIFRRHPPNPAPQIILPPFQVSVLRPIFTTQERNLMSETVHARPSRVIRTCYRNHPGDAARHQWLLNEYVNHSRGLYCDPDNVAPRLGASGCAPEFLNDAARYDFGSDYEKLFAVCPDLLHHGQGGCHPIPAPQRLADLFESYRVHGYYNLEHALSVALTWLADKSIINWMHVEDEAFFDGEPVLLVYYDECGRTCYTQRQGPSVGDEAGKGSTPAQQHGGWISGGWRDGLNNFRNGEGLGVAYREDGVVGKRWMSAVKKDAERLRQIQEARA